MRVPSKLKLVARMTGYGISAAGIVNTLAPGLFSTTLGYVAGSLRGTAFASVMVKAGLFTLGAFATPMISNYGILAVGAVVGFLLGLLLSLGMAVFNICRKRHRRGREEQLPPSGPLFEHTEPAPHVPLFPQENSVPVPPAAGTAPDPAQRLDNLQ